MSKVAPQCPDQKPASRFKPEITISSSEFGKILRCKSIIFRGQVGSKRKKTIEQGGSVFPQRGHSHATVS